MTAVELVEAVQEAGGSLTLNGDRIKYILPKPAAWLVGELRQQKAEVVRLLQLRTAIPPMPPGISLVKWEPKEPPVAIVHMGVVTDVPKFVAATLRELEARLQGKDSLAGNWSLRELAERLEQVGVEVEVVAEQAVRSTSS